MYVFDLTLLLVPCYTVFRCSLPIGSALKPAKLEAAETKRRERLPYVKTALAQQQQCTYIRPAVGQWTNPFLVCFFLRLFLLAFFPSPHIALATA